MPDTLTGWGRTGATVAQVVAPASVEETSELVRRVGPRGVLARGMGRSYGDAAQNAGGVVLDLNRLNSIGAIDPATGELTCGAGASLDAVLRTIVAAGWFVPVTPGTRMISMAGAVAADVHGKNHHCDGSIGRHIQRLEIVDGLGQVRTLTPADDLFWATVGGMGLTGVITELTLRLIPISSAWLAADTWRTTNLDDTMQVLADCDARHRYSVAWIDCLCPQDALGRGVVSAADHLPADALDTPASDAPLRFSPRAQIGAPSRVPTGLLGRMPGAAFNQVYYRRAPRRSVGRLVHSASFFHPLDSVSGWNRLYGHAGFIQYQFVTPAPSTVRRVLAALRSADVPGMLAVLKRFGEPNPAPLSFPRPGWTLAVDIPARAAGLGTVLDAADRMVLESGGRVYLAKDARIAAEVFAEMYAPGLARWRESRADADPRGVFCSDLARRLQL